MSTLDLTTGVALEVIGKQALGMLKDYLNAELTTIQTRWSTLDPKLGYRPITVEQVQPDNFYYGHRPSLIEASASQYPNCSVMAYSAQPDPESFMLDHEDVYDVRLFVELMCKSVNEQEVNSRIARTAEAAHGAIMRDPTLRGLVQAIGSQPSVDLTDVFVRPEKSGGQFVWQGARLDYVVQKYSNR